MKFILKTIDSDSLDNTGNLHSKGVPFIDLCSILSLIIKINPERILEVGTYKGEFFVCVNYIIKKYKLRTILVHTCDINLELIKKSKENYNRIPEQYFNKKIDAKIMNLNCNSNEFINLIKEFNYDLVFIDGEPTSDELYNCRDIKYKIGHDMFYPNMNKSPMVSLRGIGFKIFAQLMKKELLIIYPELSNCGVGLIY